MNSRNLCEAAIAVALTTSLAVGVAAAHLEHEHPEAGDSAAHAVEEAGGSHTAVESVRPEPSASRDAAEPFPAHEEGGKGFFAWLGRLHPLVVHFPIALLLSAFVAEIAYARTRASLFRDAVRFCIWGGTIAAVVAAPLGWVFAASSAHDEGWILEAHRWWGTAASIGAVALLSLLERTERTSGSRTPLRFVLTAEAVLIAVAGFLGGSLLYGIDHLWKLH